jgi:hypothetical protein
VVVGGLQRGRQDDTALPVHFEKGHLAAHLLEAPVRFSPVYFFAEHPGELLAVGACGDETAYQVHLFCGEFAATVSHGSKDKEKEARCPALFQRPPHVRLPGVLVPQKGLELVRGEGVERLAGLRPEAKDSLRQPLLAKPISLGVIGQYSERRAASAAKDEEATAEGVEMETPAYPREAVDPLSEVDGLDGHEDAHLGRDLDHAKNTLTSSATLQLPVIVILSPVGFAISTVAVSVPKSMKVETLLPLSAAGRPSVRALRLIY